MRRMRRRTIAASLLLSCAALLATGHGSGGREGTAPLGVSLTIIAGCTVSSSPGFAIIVTCTNEVPFQLGITGGAGDAATRGAQPEPQISLAPGAASDAVTVVVTY